MPPDLRPRLRAWRWWEDLGAPLLAGDPRLVPVPSIPSRGCLLHWYAAGCLEALSSAWRSATGDTLLVQSGHRLAKPWQATEELYHAELLRRYTRRWPGATDEQIIRRGRMLLARRSAHQTGLCIDLGCGGLSPDSRTIPAQRAMLLSRWLDDAAPRHGWRRFAPEPWHLEAVTSREVYESLPPEGYSSSAG